MRRGFAAKARTQVSQIIPWFFFVPLISAVSVGLVRAESVSFLVDTLEDTADAEPGDGVCADASGACSLRAALTEAIPLEGETTIRFGVEGTIALQDTLPLIEGSNDDDRLRIDGGAKIRISGEGAGPILSVNTAVVTLQDLVFEQGRGYRAGALHLSGTINLVRVGFYNNVADTEGGAITVGDSDTVVTLEDCVFEGNRSDRNGGAIFVDSGTVRIATSRFQGNEAADSGGAIAIAGASTAYVASSEFRDNRAGIAGGAVWNDHYGALEVVDSLFAGNQVSEGDDAVGGAIASRGQAVVDSSTRVGNSSSGSGGAVWNEGSLAVRRSRILANSSAVQGGGVFTWGFAEIQESALVANVSEQGAGVANGDRLTLKNVTVSGNEAQSVGGGIYTLGGGAAVVFSTFYGNSAAEDGAAIFVTGSGRVTMKNSVIAGAQVSSVPNCSGKVDATGVNYADDTSCDGFVSVSTAALGLGPLRDNGGGTETHAPQHSSVAIDAAPDCTDAQGNPVATDQRGQTRPGGLACDAGSFELSEEEREQPTPDPTLTPPTSATPTPTPSEDVTPQRMCIGDCDGSGQCTIDELITMVNIALNLRRVEECTPGDANGDGQVTIEEILMAVNRSLNGC